MTKSLRCWIAPMIIILAGCPGLAQTVAGPPSIDATTERRVEAILSQLTQEEKLRLIAGNGFAVRGIPRLGLPSLQMTDGTYGVRSGRATVIPGGIGLAATWNVDLARKEGQVVGSDAKARGTKFQLAPAVNISRAPQAGRNFEYFGEDPFLASKLAVGFIEGLQSQGVSAVVKHFVGNDSEFARNYTDAVIDERTLREIYLAPFEAAVKEAHVGAVMDSYNLVNGEYMSANRHLNIDVLKNEWAFDGIVMSDWISTHDPLGPARGGLDLEMPTGASMNASNLLPAIADGRLPQSVIDDKVRRLLRTEARFGWLDATPKASPLPLLNEEGRQVALQGARESVVLLKNEDQLLPIKAREMKTIALIGPLAYPLVPAGGGSSQATPYVSSSLLAALSTRLHAHSSILYDRGLPTYGKVAQETKYTTDPEGMKPGIQVERFDNISLSGSPKETRTDRRIDVGTGIDMALLSGEQTTFGSSFPGGKMSYRWSGYYTPTDAGNFHIFIDQSGGGEKTGYRIFLDDKLIKDDWAYPEAIVDDLPVHLASGPHKVVIEFWAQASFVAPLFRVGIKMDATWVDPRTLELAKRADAVVLSVGFDPSTEFEGWDRTFHLPIGQEELIHAVAAANPNTIVILQGGGNIDSRTWLGDVKAVLHSWYPGQEGGTAIAEILAGDISPSGHLPVTFERSPADNPTWGNYYPASADHSATPKVIYREGVFVGYRGYQRNHTSPLFPFGFGLSYTTFVLSDIHVKAVRLGDTNRQYDISVSVMNKGTRSGKAVVQLYVAPTMNNDVERPEEELKGFRKINLKPGETKRLTMPLGARAFSFYSVSRHCWIATAGRYDIRIGQSSVDKAVTTSITLRKEIETR